MHVSAAFPRLLAAITTLAGLITPGVTTVSPPQSHPSQNQTSSPITPAAALYFDHSTAPRINTDAIIYRLLTEQHASADITIIPLYNINLLSHAAAGFANATLLTQTQGASLDSYQWHYYRPPNRRKGRNSSGTLLDDVKFGVYRYVWRGKEFLMYVVDGRDGWQAYGPRNQYVIGPRSDVDELMREVGDYGSVLHDEIWVFDAGYWSKSAELWRTIMRSRWEDVILDDGMKRDIIGNALRFFNSSHEYARLHVPWKRGIIFHGPPGNGKTISIKAMMHTLYSLSDPIPTLYVKSLSGYGEYALGSIFNKAREEAPCYLVFEDLDSLVSADLRSYFLNQVDGLQENNGILMVGSTNHLDLLDPGLAKRPSRFDRKFYFPDPPLAQRIQYCEYWRKKLASNDEIDFPLLLVSAIANITYDFSFAYIQEAFVASLLLIAAGEAGETGVGHRRAAQTEQHVMVGHKELEDVLLWRVIREQVHQLRQELEEGVTGISGDRSGDEKPGSAKT